MTLGLRLVAATALAAAAGLTASPPAYAEPCSSDTGVTVVVDFHELGGGLQQGCVADQGTADDLFVAAGHTLQNVNGQAFVCRVDGLPTQDQESCVRTPPPDAYWGLWWSDGQSGSWNFSSQGAYSLDVPAGGSVAFSWNGSTAKSPPGAPPPEHATEEPSEDPEPTNEPTSRPSESPASSGGTSGSDTPSASSSGSDLASPGGGDGRGRPEDDPDEQRSDRDRRGDRDREGATDEPSEESSPTTSSDGSTVAEPPASGDEPALPVWIGPTAVGGLLGVAGVATYLRRRTH